VPQVQGRPRSEDEVEEEHLDSNKGDVEVEEEQSASAEDLGENEAAAELFEQEKARETSPVVSQEHVQGEGVSFLNCLSFQLRGCPKHLRLIWTPGRSHAAVSPVKKAGPAEDRPDTSDVHEETPGRFATIALLCHLYPYHL